ncbi:MAG TPA: lytic transglycosylase domain-containing protein [Blastocatellia bacterium]|nr:lytic transglycosylase domain-containing protein [Blastocatellia bacterium]
MQVESSVTRSRIACALATLFFVLVTGIGVLGQTQQSNQQSGQIQQVPDQVEATISQAQQTYLEGIEAFNKKDFGTAKRKFDDALDQILSARLNSSDTRLDSYYRKLVDNISNLQIEAAIAKADSFGIQIYTPTPGDELAQVTDTELNSLGETGLKVSNKDFAFKATLAPPVYQFITYFTQGSGRQTMLIGLQRAGKYRSLAERVFKEEGVPTDLIWLAQVESLWSNTALSYAAARGMWQFVPGTGARFGLAQTAWVDERSDPEKSTRAAARYLKYLADYFNGDWLLAMAAYNCGEGRVGSVIRQSKVTDYWSLRSMNLLPQETRNYVPAILAAIAIAKNPKQYGFNIAPEAPQEFVVQTVKTQTSLSALAQKLKMPLSSLLALNPELQRGVTPPGAYNVRIPKHNGSEYITVNAVKTGDNRPTVTPDSEVPPKQ